MGKRRNLRENQDWRLFKLSLKLKIKGEEYITAKFVLLKVKVVGLSLNGYIPNNDRELQLIQNPVRLSYSLI